MPKTRMRATVDVISYKVRAKAATPIQEGDTSVTYVPVAGPKTSVINDFEGSRCQTMADVWDWSVRRCSSCFIIQ